MDRETEQTGEQRSLILHCKVLAPGRVRGWNGLLAAAGGDDISVRPKGQVKTSQVVVQLCVYAWMHIILSATLLWCSGSFASVAELEIQL